MHDKAPLYVKSTLTQTETVTREGTNVTQQGKPATRQGKTVYTPKPVHGKAGPLRAETLPRNEETVTRKNETVTPQGMLNISPNRYLARRDRWEPTSFHTKEPIHGKAKPLGGEASLIYSHTNRYTTRRNRLTASQH